ncbi:MAG: GNAT family N-acetyltransferase [Rhodocyclales bacterium]|nr:GNAT family N-acetyltransferase [Rhodocyclales bacterium]
MEVRVIDSAEQFLAIATDWNELLETADAASIFMTWEWNHHWWQHYGKHHSLCIVTVWDDDRLKAILPIYLQQTRVLRIWPTTTARFIGTGGDTSPDYLGPILDPASANLTIPVLVTFVIHQLPNWSILCLSDLDQSSDFYAELDRQFRACGYFHTSELSATIALAALPRTWDDYLASLNGDRRNTIRRTRRKIETQHQGRFYVVTEENQVDDVLGSLIELHHKRWQGNPEGHSFSTPEYIAFHRDVVHAIARHDRIRLYCLEADGKRIAVLYCYRFRNQIFYFQAGFDPDYERLRPGLVLIGYSLEHAIGEGNDVYDFLRGDHGYKTQWGKSRRETHAFTAFRPGAQTTLHLLQTKGISRLKGHLKRIFPALARNRNAHGSNAGKQHGA